MNKYENLITKLIKLTKDNKIKWTVSKSPYDFFSNKSTITKAFETSYDSLDFLWVEAKEMTYYPDFDNYYEDYNYYLVLIKNDIAARYISDKNVDTNILQSLDNIITNTITEIDGDIDSIISDDD
jgi:hypothetical protein